MGKIYSVFLIAGCLLQWGCNPNYEEPDTAIDAGRQFISAIYNGNFKRAGQLVVPDDENRELLRKEIENDFRSRNSFNKEMLSKASIQISEIKMKDSTTTQIKFLNAYNGNESYIIVIKVEGLWKVNLKNISP